ncbi:MAG: S41 family peptidase [Thermoanaerobaculia bacterium]
MNGKRITFLAVSIALLVTLLAGGLFGQGVAPDSVYRYLNIFTEVFSLVRSNYVEEVDPDTLVEGAFDGLTDAIDEYSYYVPPARMAEYRDYVRPGEAGTGLVVSRRFGYGYVIAPLEGSPAEAAGIEPGDFIEQIEGRPTQEMALWEIRKALHGEPGTSVELVILKGSMNKRIEHMLERTSFTIPDPAFETIRGIGYVKIAFFDDDTPAAFAGALAAAREAGIEKLIVDVRGNADGSIPAAIATADLLLGQGRIAQLEGRRLEPKTWNADADTAWEGELVVLADASTTGGGEVFAAAIQDNERGRVIGTRTYGKAIEQKLVRLPSGGALMVTVGDYNAPDDAPIREEGIRPDVVVDLTPLAIRSEEEAERELPDLILEKALSVLGGTEGEKKAA